MVILWLVIINCVFMGKLILCEFKKFSLQGSSWDTRVLDTDFILVDYLLTNSSSLYCRFLQCTLSLKVLHTSFYFELLSSPISLEVSFFQSHEPLLVAWPLPILTTNHLDTWILGERIIVWESIQHLTFWLCYLCAKCFTCVISFSPYNTLLEYVYIKKKEG